MFEREILTSNHKDIKYNEIFPVVFVCLTKLLKVQGIITFEIDLNIYIIRHDERGGGGRHAAPISLSVRNNKIFLYIPADVFKGRDKIDRQIDVRDVIFLIKNYKDSYTSLWSVDFRSLSTGNQVQRLNCCRHSRLSSYPCCKDVRVIKLELVGSVLFRYSKTSSRNWKINLKLYCIFFYI